MLRHNPISGRNSRLISKFLDHCVSILLGNARVAKYAGHLKELAELLGKDFEEANREDIERVVAKIQAQTTPLDEDGLQGYPKALLQVAA